MKINENCFKYILCNVAVTLSIQTFDSQVYDKNRIFIEMLSGSVVQIMINHCCLPIGINHGLDYSHYLYKAVEVREAINISMSRKNVNSFTLGVGGLRPCNFLGRH